MAEPDALALYSAWKKIPGRNHVSAFAYQVRTSDNTSGGAAILHSDSLLVNPTDVSKLMDDKGQALVVCLGTVVHPDKARVQGMGGKNPQVTTLQLLSRKSRLLQNGKDDGRQIGQAEVK